MLQPYINQHAAHVHYLWSVSQSEMEKSIKIYGCARLRDIYHKNHCLFPFPLILHVRHVNVCFYHTLYSFYFCTIRSTTYHPQICDNSALLCHKDVNKLCLQKERKIKYSWNIFTCDRWSLYLQSIPWTTWPDLSKNHRSLILRFLPSPFLFAMSHFSTKWVHLDTTYVHFSIKLPYLTFQWSAVTRHALFTRNGCWCS